MSADDGFLSRWSKRKVQAKAGVVPKEEPAVPPVVLAKGGTGEQSPAVVDPAPRRDDPVEQPPPPPTLEDAAALRPGAEVHRFIAPNVDESVQRAALKKLFADPHFNVMDGLDTYIDDYGKPDPIPESMLRQMVQSRALGLFADEEPDPKASTDGEAAPAVPQSPDVSKAVPDEDPDLRLQQDDAAGPGGAEPGPRA